MFSRIASFTVKYRIWIILSWIVAVIVLFLLAPSLSSVSTVSQSSSLPVDTESQQARQIINQYFPNSESASSATLVFFNPAGLTDSDMTYARGIRDWLKSESSLNVENVTDVFDNPQLETRLVSPDHTTMLINVGFGQSIFEANSKLITDTIRAKIQPPKNLKVYVSGQMGIYGDLMESINNNVGITTYITVALVLVLLVVIYRSPIAALIPLFTIGIAYAVSRGALGYMAEAGITIWSQLESFIIVLAFGVGTDYCLFMVSRFREELKNRNDRSEAMKATVGKMGSVITASALAVIVGLTGMMSAQYGLIKNMGPALSVTVLITFLAALTLAPALASIFGRKLFWPRHEDKRKEEFPKENQGLWTKVSRLTTGKPYLIIGIVVALLLIPYAAIPGMARSFNQMSELPANAESVQGYRILEQHYDVGEMEPLSVVIVDQSKDLSGPDGLKALQGISNNLRKIEGIGKAQSIASPEGNGVTPIEFTVSGQMKSLVANLAQSGGNSSNLTQESFQTLNNYINEVGQNFPWVKQDVNYSAASENLKDIMGILQEGVSSPEAAQTIQQRIGDLAQQLAVLATTFENRDNPLFLAPSLINSSSQAQDTVNYFLSQNKKVARMYIVINEYPNSNKAIETINEAREILKSSLKDTSLNGAHALIGGTSAETADISSMLSSDFTRVAIFVMAGLLIVLGFLLRSVIAPLYLLATVFLSYGATIGLITWIFQGVLGQSGVGFMVPIILFVLLVALGSDYNIFLMSRVREESQTLPTKQGTMVASAITGAIITACGIILAGTFGVLAISPSLTLMQLGIAVALGVLIDTFVVRALLVPAIASKLGKYNWWPSKYDLKAGVVQKKYIFKGKADSLAGK